MPFSRAASLSLLAVSALFPIVGSLAADLPPLAAEPAKPHGWVARHEWLPQPAGDETAGHLRHSQGIRYLTIHHTQGDPAAASTREGALATVRGIYHLHRREPRKWGETAYHYFISPGGLIIEGRAEEFQTDSGTTYSRSPTGRDGHVCISLLGDFRTLEEKRTELRTDIRAEKTQANAAASAQGKPPPYTPADIDAAVTRALADFSSPPDTPPTPAALRALDRLLASARAKHHLPRTALSTHREVAPTNCPGALLQSEIEKRR